MIVTIWRHGEAGSAVSDQQRELTGSGIEDVGFGCQQLQQICQQRGMPQPEHVLHSSWVRTTQTAGIIAVAFAHCTLASCQALLPGGTPVMVDTALDDILQRSNPPAHLVLVSHQPLVSRLVDHYLGQPGRAPGLSPGGLVALELDVAAADCAKLLWWALPPAYEAHA